MLRRVRDYVLGGDEAWGMAVGGCHGVLGVLGPGKWLSLSISRANDRYCAADLDSSEVSRVLRKSLARQSPSGPRTTATRNTQRASHVGVFTGIVYALELSPFITRAGNWSSGLVGRSGSFWHEVTHTA
ncbi:hypothetical protein E2C01_042456 [Portunus trituberculatus]|uniref:Uncharacterized protein n=1 Tax=Portunus trituberculatus TaxID=210409 RepID=A0A5B7FUP6_PORTR|nr:hypothetical protein [Portunus trituberculatus]